MRGGNKYFWNDKLDFEKWKIYFVVMVSLFFLNFMFCSFCCLDKKLNVKIEIIYIRRRYGDYLIYFWWGSFF